LAKFKELSLVYTACFLASKPEIPQIIKIIVMEIEIAILKFSIIDNYS